MKLNSSITSTIIKIFVLSLAVGLVMSAFDIRPETLLADFGETVLRIFDVLVKSVEWAVPYVLVGAIVVVPLWVVQAGVRLLRRRRK